eukprot:09083.XXX_24134_22748_1 [CDS] Oithona nana genome sequencing.
MASTLCYNRGCGKQYNPRNNPEDSCLFHPGAPKFHDAYKGWTCCEKKSTDFTEFLNFPGCTQGKHSNLKPEEPESITGIVGEANDIELPQVSNVEPNRPSLESIVRLKRPDFDTPLTRVKPTVAASLIQAVKGVQAVTIQSSDDEIPIGETCKNKGCKKTYQGEEPKANECMHHPGVPIFHEGLKFWTCCQRKTTDFQAFLNQEGCTMGNCKWKSDSEGSNVVECRFDWHQTATHVVVAIYGKKYDPDTSYVELSSVRMKCHIVFPEQGGFFNMDIELRGMISIEESKASFLGTKVEIKMRKAEAGSWSKLDIPQEIVEKKESTPEPQVEDIDDDLDDFDLDDLDISAKKIGLSKEASGGRTDKEII